MKQKTSQPTPQLPSFVPAPVAALASAVLPGLGQILARSYRRGVLIFFSLLTIVVLTVWRFRLAAPRDTGFGDIFRKALRLEPFLIAVLVLIAILYLWSIVDAYVVARQQTAPTVGLMFMILLVFFALGWQIGEINLVAMITQADDAGPALGRVLWPWSRAIEYPEELLVVWADVQIPCSDEPPPPTEALAAEPYIVASPTCGLLSEQSGESGTILTLNGYNMEPGIEAQIVWEDSNLAQFRQRQAGEYVIVVPEADGSFEVEIVMPYRLLPPECSAGCDGLARGG